MENFATPKIPCSDFLNVLQLLPFCDSSSMTWAVNLVRQMWRKRTQRTFLLLVLRGYNCVTGGGGRELNFVFGGREALKKKTCKIHTCTWKLCVYAFGQVDGVCFWCSCAKTLSIQPGSRMQMHQAQVPFPKMPTATMSREDLMPQKPSALPLDQVRVTQESRAQMRASFLSDN